MVAIGILGLAVTLILSAQGGLASTNKSASNMGVAVSLGRCRMSEIEEKLLKLGYSEVDEIDSSRSCCDDKEEPGFSCDWRIEKVQLPPPPNTTAGDGGANFGVGIGADGGLGVPGVISGFGANFDGDGGVGGLLSASDGGFTPSSIDLDAGLAGMGQMLSGGGGALGLLSMVFTIVYPSLKPLLEFTIRRVTVTVKWTEGVTNREFTLTQFVTNPARAGMMSGALIDGGTTGPVGTSTGAPGPTIPGQNMGTPPTGLGIQR